VSDEYERAEKWAPDPPPIIEHWDGRKWRNGRCPENENCVFETANGFSWYVSSTDRYGGPVTHAEAREKVRTYHGYHLVDTYVPREDEAI
jgi:hypothetical protein